MKPSELLEKAIADLKILLSEGVKVDMCYWMTLTESKEVCTVCLAGAYLYKTLGVKKDNPFVSCLPYHDELSALNQFRMGKIMDGLERLNIFTAIESVYVPPFEQGERLFFGGLERVVSILKGREL